MSNVHESIPTVNSDTAWRDAIRRVSELAQARLPEAFHGRIQRGTALVLSGGVCREEDGRTYQVRTSDGKHWYVVTRDHCPCVDRRTAPRGLCKHQFACKIHHRANEEAAKPLPVTVDAAVGTDTPAEHEGPSAVCGADPGQALYQIRWLASDGPRAGLDGVNRDLDLQ